ncbi:hypothetical protein MA16_Dca004168 [Dendrobium catenatum]|uniref:Uncharacterized protein n=1 Tax=Dendrobium catenatum TaxID=906689 RepID=A0A2I0X2L9_9ASPA|nr:hypothetical protein MA16_Dca004168 [Dendrobium catenatum]
MMEFSSFTNRRRTSTRRRTFILHQVSTRHRTSTGYRTFAGRLFEDEFLPIVRLLPDVVLLTFIVRYNPSTSVASRLRFS